MEVRTWLLKAIVMFRCLAVRECLVIPVCLAVLVAMAVINTPAAAMGLQVQAASRPTPIATMEAIKVDFHMSCGTVWRHLLDVYT